MNQDKIIDPELLSIDTLKNNFMSYYLYTKGKLRGPVTKEEDEYTEFIRYVDSLPSIEVSPELAKLWKEGQRLQFDKDFTFGWWDGQKYYIADKPDCRDDSLMAIPRFPIPAPEKEESQDDMWKEIKNKLLLSNTLDPEWAESFKKEFLLTRIKQ